MLVCILFYGILSLCSYLDWYNYVVGLTAGRIISLLLFKRKKKTSIYFSASFLILFSFQSRVHSSATFPTLKCATAKSSFYLVWMELILSGGGQTYQLTQGDCQMHSLDFPWVREWGNWRKHLVCFTTASLEIYPPNNSWRRVVWLLPLWFYPLWRSWRSQGLKHWLN